MAFMQGMTTRLGYRIRASARCLNCSLVRRRTEPSIGIDKIESCGMATRKALHKGRDGGYLCVIYKYLWRQTLPAAGPRRVGGDRSFWGVEMLCCGRKSVNCCVGLPTKRPSSHHIRIPCLYVDESDFAGWARVSSEILVPKYQITKVLTSRIILPSQPADVQTKTPAFKLRRRQTSASGSEVWAMT